MGNGIARLAILHSLNYPYGSQKTVHVSFSRRGVRVAEGARLEIVLWVTPYEGSNPSLSAMYLILLRNAHDEIDGPECETAFWTRFWPF